MVTSSTNMSKVSINPKLVFGVNGQMRNSLHLYDEKKLIFVTGLNVVILDIDTGNQSFIPASPNATKISSIKLSPQGRYLSVCEQAHPFAQVQIIEVANRR